MNESIIITLIGAAVSIASVIALIYKSRGENKNSALNAKTALDQRIDERVARQLETAWEEIDQLKKSFQALETKENQRTGAITRILRAIAIQWKGVDGPDLDPRDIEILEETIPPAWIRRPTNN